MTEHENKQDAPVATATTERQSSSSTTASTSASMHGIYNVSEKHNQAEQTKSNPLARLGHLPEWPLRRGGPLLSGRALNWGVTLVANAGFCSFGYDQGLFSALVTLDTFQQDVPIMAPYNENIPYCLEPGQCLGTTSTQSAGIAIYQAACMLGGVAVLFWGEAWGRRASTFWGCFLMIVGTVFQAGMAGGPATTYALFLVGRVIGGIGNGIVTSTIPTWQSECAKPKDRGMIIILSGAMISAGIMLSYWVNYGFFFAVGSVRWRVPMALQCVFTVFVMIGLLFLCDSPRWLLLKGRRQESLEVIARLAGKSVDDDDVQAEMHSVEEALAIQTSGGGFKFRELLDRGPNRNLQRTAIAVTAQAFQQLSGINLLTYYLALLLEQSLGFGPAMARLISAANGTEYFLASLVAIPLVDRSGRRILMLVGAAGMSVCMAIVSGTVSTGVIVDGAPVLDDGPGIAAVVMLFLFNTFFAIGWLGMTWLYPAELTNLRIRIRANALATCSNWLWNFVIVFIAPPALEGIGHHTYTIFAILNALIVPIVWLYFPETKSRSLEELDVVFASAHSLNISAVKQSLTMPHLDDATLQAEMERYFGQEAKVRARGIEQAA